MSTTRSDLGLRSMVFEGKALSKSDCLHTLPNSPDPFEGSRKRGCTAANSTSSLRMTRGRHQYLYDSSGSQYLDCVTATSHVGHCHPQVLSAGHTQSARLASAQGLVAEGVRDKYINALLATLPEKLNVCYLCNSGSEANDLALRLARAYTGNEAVVVHEDSYHGNLSSLIDLSPKVYKSIPKYVKKDFVHLLPLPKSDDEELNVLAIDHVLDKVDRMAATLLDPMLLVPGLYTSSKTYMSHLFKAVRQRGGLCIVDEVQTGLGRTGEHFWGFQNFGNIVPDILTVGKPLGNGHPMAAVICNASVANVLGSYHSTFGGNPVSCSIGLAVLEVIHTENLVASARNVGKTMQRLLNDIRKKFGKFVGQVRGCGLMWAVELVKDGLIDRPFPELAMNVMFGLKRRRIVVAITGDAKNVILVTPPMCFTMDNCQTFCSALSDVLTECSASAEVELMSLCTGSSGLKRRREDMEQSCDDKFDCNLNLMDNQQVQRELEAFEDVD